MNIALHCNGYHCIRLHSSTLHWVVSKYIALQWISVHKITFECITLGWTEVNCIAMDISVLDYIWVHYIGLDRSTMHCNGFEWALSIKTWNLNCSICYANIRKNPKANISEISHPMMFTNIRSRRRDCLKLSNIRLLKNNTLIPWYTKLINGQIKQYDTKP